MKIDIPDDDLLSAIIRNLCSINKSMIEIQDDIERISTCVYDLNLQFFNACEAFRSIDRNLKLYLEDKNG